MYFVESIDGSTIEVPSTFGKYIIKKELGKGSFGKVFKVEKGKNSGQFFAAKIFPMNNDLDSQKLKEGITNEYEILSTINHPNIIKFYDSFEHQNEKNENFFVIILEYCSRGNLVDYIKGNKFWNKHQKKKMMRNIIEAVVHLNERGIAHCDIKLDNIMIDENFNVKLIDFNLSKNLNGKHNNKKVGTVKYAAPEIFSSAQNIDFFKSDIWSLGVVLFAMSENKFPYGDYREIFKISFKIKMKNKKLKKVIKNCFKRDPRLRPDPQFLLNYNYFENL